MFADKIWGDYKFHLVILLCCVLAELVGPIRICLLYTSWGRNYGQAAEEIRRRYYRRSACEDA